MFEQFINQLAWLNHVFQFCSYHNSWLSFITNLFSKRAMLKDNLWTKFWPRRAEQDQPQRDYAQALTDRCSLWLPRSSLMGSAGQSHTNSSRQSHRVQPSPSAAPGTRASSKRKGSGDVALQRSRSPRGNRGGAGPALGIESDPKVSLQAEVSNYGRKPLVYIHIPTDAEYFSLLL